MAEVRQDHVQVELDVKAEKARTELDNLTRQASVLNNELKGMKRGTDDYIAANKQLTQVNSRMGEIRKELGITGMNYIQLGKYTKELNRELIALTPGTESFINKSKELTQVTARMKEVKAQMDGIAEELPKAGNGWKDMASKALGFIGIGVGVAAVTEGVTAIATEVKETISEFDNLRKQISQLTGASGEELDSMTSSVAAIAKTFDKDFNEVLITANTLSKQMGITQEQALAKIKTGFLAGADAGGQFLDQVQEYAPQFKAAGASADDLLLIITQSVKDGIFSDKGADVVKEFGFRIREQTSTTRDALENAFGEKFTGELFANINNGSISTVDALKLVSRGLNETELTASQTQTIIADVFGGPGEDAGLDYLKSLQNMGGAMSDLINTSNIYVQRQQELLKSEEDLAAAQNELTKTFSGGGDVLKTLTNDSLTFLYTLLVGLVGVFGDLFAPVAQLWNYLSDLAVSMGIFSKEGNAAKNIALVLVGIFEALTTPLRLVYQVLSFVTRELVEMARASPNVMLAVYQIADAFTFIYDLLKNAPAYLAGFEAAFKQTFGNVRQMISLVMSGDFKGAAAVWSGFGKSTSSAYNKAFLEEQKKGQAERKAAEQTPEAQTKNKSQGISPEEKAARTKAAEERKKEQEKEAADRKKAKEKELADQQKAELEAAKAIEDMRNSLIENEFDKKVAILRTQAQREITEAKGSADQISAQKLLIENKLSRDIEAIEKEKNAQALKLATDRAKQEAAIRNNIALAQADLEVALASRKNNLGETADPAALLQAKINQLQTQKEVELREADATAKELLQQDLNNLQLKGDARKLYELQAQAELNAEKLAIEAEYQNQVGELNAAAAEERRQKEVEATTFGLQNMQALTGTFFDFKKIESDKELAKTEKDKNARLKKLDAEYKTGRISKEQYESSKSSIETNYDSKARELKKKAAKDEKSNNIAQSIMSGILGVIKAAPNIPLQIATGILAAASTAKIAATPIPTFGDGGFFGRMIRNIGRLPRQMANFSSNAWRGVRQYADGGVPQYANGGINSNAGVAEVGSRHYRGGIQMIDGETGEHLGEWERGEPYMILSRNTLANNGDIIHKLLDSSLHRSGARVKFADGGIGGNATLPTSSGGEDFGILVNEVIGLREDVRNQNTLIKAYVVATDVEGALNELTDLRVESGV